MESLTADALVPVRVTLLITSLFGMVALVMAAVGLYSVVTFLVRQRSREIGIRLALGQTPGEVTWMIIGRGMRLVGLAILAGSFLSIALGGFASSFFYQIHPSDPATYAWAIGVLAVAALAACWLPARRAARIDPVEMLRVE